MGVADVVFKWCMILHWVSQNDRMAKRGRKILKSTRKKQPDKSLLSHSSTDTTECEYCLVLQSLYPIMNGLCFGWALTGIDILERVTR